MDSPCREANAHSRGSVNYITVTKMNKIDSPAYTFDEPYINKDTPQAEG
jgi:hypothetical protein